VDSLPTEVCGKPPKERRPTSIQHCVGIPNQSS